MARTGLRRSRTILCNRSTVCLQGRALRSLGTSSASVQRSLSDDADLARLRAAFGPLLSGFFLGRFAMPATYRALVFVMSIALLAQVFRRARRAPPRR